MAIYQFNPATKHQALLFPYQFLAANGAEARHDTTAADKAVDERGTPKKEYALITRRENRLLYENATDWGNLSADEKTRAFWASDSALLTRYTNKGVIVAR